MEKGLPIFLAHVTAKEVEDKSEKKRLEDVPMNTGTLSIGAFRNERVIRSTERAVRKRFYKIQFLTLVSSSLVCQEEGWIIPDVH
ncbi:hypothetical protein Tco_1149261 [Tanacetum coccineum]